MTRSLDQHRLDWERLGADDPLWAVLMKPGTKDGGWDPDDFLATGRAEVDRVLADLAGLGGTPGTGLAVDYGCGAGRATQALARHFDRVIGVDISEPMLATAAALDRSEGSCEFRLTEPGSFGAIEPQSADLVYSSLVIQHLPPAAQGAALAGLANLVAPGGAIAVQVVTVPLRNVKGYLFKYAPWPLLRLGQRTVLKYPAPMRMTATPAGAVLDAWSAAGIRLLGRVEDHSYGGHWVYHRYFGTRS